MTTVAYRENIKKKNRGGREKIKLTGPLNLKMDDPDLICVFEHNTPMSTKYVTVRV
jgi:hypothetical protein